MAGNRQMHNCHGVWITLQEASEISGVKTSTIYTERCKRGISLERYLDEHGLDDQEKIMEALKIAHGNAEETSETDEAANKITNITKGETEAPEDEIEDEPEEIPFEDIETDEDEPDEPEEAPEEDENRKLDKLYLRKMNNAINAIHEIMCDEYEDEKLPEMLVSTFKALSAERMSVFAHMVDWDALAK